MKESPYRERDYAFGQVMLTVRTRLGLTQSEVADLLGVGRRAVIDWEGGLTYPTVDHLKHFVVLAIERQAFPAGREAEEVRALWQAAHQKVLLDEAWLAGLLSHRQAAPAYQPGAKTSATSHALASPSSGGPRVDWGDALAVTSFYGREWELELLAAWVVDERCRVVSVLGQGGIGKSALATQVMHRVAVHFEVVIWRSLRDVPSCEALLDSCLQVLAPEKLHDSSASLERRQDLLLECLRTRRVLLVYDNLESFLEEGEDSGRIRAGYEGFSQVLRRVAETEHQSCWLLTSREKPSDLVPLEGSHAPVRALRLAQLDAEACQQLLAEQGVAGSTSEQLRLVEAYAGNPLALKIVARTIVELFDGQIGLFLEHGEVVFGGVRALLDQQYARLSALEQSVLLWLAILREGMNLQELLAVLATPLSPATVLEAVEALDRRSLIERGQRQGSFTLHSVVLEFTTARLIAETSKEIQHSQISRLIEHGLTLAGSREYVRQTQVRLIVVPLLRSLRSAYPEGSDLEDHLLALLERLRARADYAQGYGPTNVLALLMEHRGHLRGLDLSHLLLRGAYLQDVEMQDTTLSGAIVQDCAWMATFGAIWAVAISHDGAHWAAGSRRGEIWVWAQQKLHLTWHAHADVVRALSFSPDGRHLASGSYDGLINVWDVENGALLWSRSHTTYISGLAYSPDGAVLASAATDATVQLWDAQTGALLETLPHPQAVFTITWSPDGQLLATLGFDGQIRLWKRQQHGPATCVALLAGHTNWGMGLAFSPDGSLLASASWDQTIKLWEIPSGAVLQTLTGHTDRAQTVAWSPDGRTLASAAFDHTIWLWDVEHNAYRRALHGHTDAVFSLAFLPDSLHLLSGSVDGTLRVWDAETGQSEQIRQGYADSLYDIAWSPTGAPLASGSSNGLVTIWDAENLTPPRLLQGHRHLVFGVEWSPDGKWLASSGWDNAIQIWDATTATSVQVMRDPDDHYTSFYGLAWSPDGQRLACGNYRHEVQVWEVASGRYQWIAREQPASVRRVAWSPDGILLVSAGDDGIVAVWNASDGRLLRQLTGHQGKVNDVAWSRDGKWLASGAGSRDGGEVFVWDMHSGERVRVLSEHPGIVYAVAWGPTGAMLVSGGSDGMLRWWDVERGECVWMREAHQGTVQSLEVSRDGRSLASCGDDGAINVWELASGEHLRTLRRDRPYERMDITGLRGITPAQRASLIALGAQEQLPGRDALSPTTPDLATSEEPTRADQHVASSLPVQPTSFIGRSQELDAIARLLADPACRLLTLLGPGGIGKTRLALAVAASETAAFPDGVAFVALASIGTPSQIVSAIGDTLGLSFAGHSDPTAHLVGYLRERHMLLVLDNFEHLLAGADLLATILERAPQVSILVTSRERLNLQAEWVFDVDGLAFPQEDPHGSAAPQSLADLADYSAVQLFLQRATQVQPRLSLSQEALTTIVRICQHVAGMPLAIELAAAGVRALSLADIEWQLRANLDVLATSVRDVPLRHRSMRAVFDHSWNLLSESERAAFSHVAVFRGGWTVKAAQQVAGATLGVLTVLVDKSLVRKDSAAPRSAIDRGASEADTELRFILLEPIREYALGQLAARGEAEALRRAHACYYSALAEAAAAQWDSPTAEAMIKQLDCEHDNLRAALHWTCNGGDHTIGLRLAGALRKFWQSRGLISEGRAWLAVLLVRADTTHDAAGLVARRGATQAAAWLASNQHDFGQAEQLFEQSITLQRVLGEPAGETQLLFNAALQARAMGQYHQAITLLEEAVTQHRVRSDRGSLSAGGLGLALYGLGLLFREQGEFARAVTLFEECMELHRALGDREGMAQAQLALGDIARDQGDVAQMRTHAEQSLLVFRELGVQWAIGFAVHNLALAAYLEGDLAQAFSLVEESIRLFRSLQADSSLAEVLITLGQIVRAQGDNEAAYTALSEALQLAWAVGPRLLVAAVLEGLAGLAIQTQRVELTVQLLAGAAALRAQMGTPVRPVDQAGVEQTLATARSTLGDAFAAVWAEAQALPLEQILKSIPSMAVFAALGDQTRR